MSRSDVNAQLKLSTSVIMMTREKELSKLYHVYMGNPSRLSNLITGGRLNGTLLIRSQAIIALSCLGPMASTKGQSLTGSWSPQPGQRMSLRRKQKAVHLFISERHSLMNGLIPLDLR